MKTHILLIDDDILGGKLLAFLLADAGYALTAITDPRSVNAFLRDHFVDLILLDVMLPYLDGYAVAAEIRRAYPETPIVFLSGRTGVSDKVAAYEHGADDFVSKPFEPNELIARILAVLRRYRRIERNVHGSVIQVGAARLDLGQLQFTAPARRPALLTPTEMKILECLMRNANAVISRGALIERTWGGDFDGFGNRVDVYIRRLRSKIEADPSDPAFTHTVRGLGYVFREARLAA